MPVNLTLAIMATALAIAIFCGWRGARKPDLRKGPRMIPWRVLMVLSATIALVMLAHLAGMAGLTAT